MDAGRVRIGTSGWTYDSWQGPFYPDGLAKRRRLEHLATRLDAAEVNGTFYSLQRASTFRGWAGATGEDFRFAVKGSRYITHMKRLRDVEQALGRFLASGPLALGEKLGPVLWQLPPAMRWDAELVVPFLERLPRGTVAAAEAARPYAELVRDPCVEVDTDRPLRHALEARHPSWRDPAVVRALREQDVSLVVSDGAGAFPRFDDVTADPVYVRLHGDTELYRSGYSATALDGWADRVRAWATEGVVGDRGHDRTGGPGACSTPRRLGVLRQRRRRARPSRRPRARRPVPRHDARHEGRACRPSG